MSGHCLVDPTGQCRPKSPAAAVRRDCFSISSASGRHWKLCWQEQQKPVCLKISDVVSGVFMRGISMSIRNVLRCQSMWRLHHAGQQFFPGIKRPAACRPMSAWHQELVTWSASIWIWHALRQQPYRHQLPGAALCMSACSSNPGGSSSRLVPLKPSLGACLGC